MHLGRFGCRLRHPLGACGPLFQRLGATFVACRFLVFFGWFPGTVKISSRAKVEGNYVPSGALNSNTKDQQTNNCKDKLISSDKETGDKFSTFTA